ncbi:MAG: protein-L-isoaspartate O-methyltransferase [Burkholderiaceae bacterium]|nr:protein-L-isoaspartate O-methyltransferase [Burkholderiaceae bacterium]
MNAAVVSPDLALEQARFNMIEQQIRPWDVLDQSVLDLLSVVRREEFVPPQLRALAFVDMEIPLRIDGADTGEKMFSPKMEARFLQELGVKAHEHVLEVGSGSGYMAALLAHKAQQVVTVEIDERLQRFATANLARTGVGSVRVELGDGSRGWAARAPYDVIMISGSLPALPDGLLAQLKIGGRLGVIVGSGPVMSAQVITRVSEQGFDTLRLFETDVKPLRNAWQPSSFRF